MSLIKMQKKSKKQEIPGLKPGKHRVFRVVSPTTMNLNSKSSNLNSMLSNLARAELAPLKVAVDMMIQTSTCRILKKLFSRRSIK